jgi:hypothetical protein
MNSLKSFICVIIRKWNIRRGLNRVPVKLNLACVSQYVGG